ncbi:MAG: hypothetical protein U5R14_11920 [Gemmatimonadota bacterium]|nr:hypothetical protein [Gemmatimonadota bacterium]
MSHLSEGRMRELVLTLLVASFAVFVHPAPTATESDSSQATLGQVSEPPPAALPTLSPTLSADASQEWSSRGHHHHARVSADPFAGHEPSISGPSDPDALTRTLGGSLLGLPTAPANAPPRG